jgi:hypothetical protein
MKEEYLKLIEDLDKLLSQARSCWLAYTQPQDKAKWMVSINEMLEGRIRLMKLRDLPNDI